MAPFVLAFAFALLAAACGGDDDGAIEGASPTTDDPTAATTPAEQSVADEGEAEGEGEIPSGEPIKLGVIAPITGPQTQLGDELVTGLEFYVEQNPAMCGRPIELIIEDSASNPQQALPQAQKLVERDNVSAVVGVVHSAVLQAVTPYIVEQEVPLVVTTAAIDAFTAQGAPEYAFRVGNSASQNTRPLAWYASEELGYDNVAILTYDFIAGAEFEEAFTDVFTSLGGTIASSQKVPLGTADFGPFISNVPSDIDALYVFLGGADAVRFFEQAESFGLKDRVSLIGAHATLDPIVLEAVGPRAEGYVSGVQYLPNADIEGNEDFVQAYQESVGRPPSFYAVDAYLALQVIDQALESNGCDVNPAAIAAALPDVEFEEAPRGAFRFDENHQAIYDLHIYETRPGEDGMEQVVVEMVEDVTQQWTPPGS